MIELNNISKSFFVNGKPLPIIRINHWSVESAERIALIGPSGCGKSTLLHLLSGVLSVDSGEINVNGYHLHQASEAQRDRFRAKQIGYIFQDFHLLSALTAKQNVELILPKNWRKQQRQEQIEAWFERLGLGDRLHHLPGQLSRGQQQRVAIIRALIGKPALVLADEPTGSLDWETANDIMSLLLELCDTEKQTLLTVTHDLHLAELFPKKVIITELNDSSHKGAKIG
jgi:putative ABC transport system ATP-binding protein